MGEDRIPFDYDKYAADPSAWKVFTNDDTLVVFVIKSSDEHEHYPYHGIVVDEDGMPSTETWTFDGWYTIDRSDHRLNLKNMEYVGKEKPVEAKVVSSLTPRLRNVYYNRDINAVVMNFETHELWTHATMSANSLMLSRPELEHLCVITLEDHPQIKEILVAKGLTKVVIDPLFEEAT